MEHYVVQHNIDVWIEKKHIATCLNMVYKYLVYNKTSLLTDIQTFVSTTTPILFWNDKQMFDLFCCLVSSSCDEKYTWSLWLKYYYVYFYYHLFTKN